MKEILEMISQVRELIDPDRSGGVSAYETGRAIAILRTMENKVKNIDLTIQAFIAFLGKQ